MDNTKILSSIGSSIFFRFKPSGIYSEVDASVRGTSESRCISWSVIRQKCKKVFPHGKWNIYYVKSTSALIFSYLKSGTNARNNTACTCKYSTTFLNFCLVFRQAPDLRTRRIIVKFMAIKKKETLSICVLCFWKKASKKNSFKITISSSFRLFWCLIYGMR